MKRSSLLLLHLVFLTLLSCGEQRVSSPVGVIQKFPAAMKTNSQAIMGTIDRVRYRDGEVIVKFKAGKGPAAGSEVLSALGAKRVRSVTSTGLDLIRLPTGVTVTEAVQRYLQDPMVEYAVPNAVARAAATLPNDIYFPRQWGLQNMGTYAGGTPGADIEAIGAWNVEQGSRNIVVAIVDTGIDYNHPDLAANIWSNSGEQSCSNGVDGDGNGYVDDCRGWNFIADSNDPMDDNGHGTHVAGIVGAVGNNGLGVSGVMWHSRLMALKACDDQGDCDLYSVANAVDYAVSNGARIINMSIGFDAGTPAESLMPLNDAIQAAFSHGVLVVASAGNEGVNTDLSPVYPASYWFPNIISVAATDPNDRLASFSNYGLNTVAVGAPGIYILSTTPANRQFSKTLCRDSGFVLYEFCDGTSMAAPHVAGEAGLIWSYYDYFTFDQVRATIMRYGTALPALEPWLQTGKRVNADTAIASLLTPQALAAAVDAGNVVRLTWIDKATGEDGYVVERRAASELQFTPCIWLGPNAIAAVDRMVVGGATYDYRVKAYNDIAQSRPSNVVSVAVPVTPFPVPASGGGGCSVAPCPSGGEAWDIALFMGSLALWLLILRKRR